MKNKLRILTNGIFRENPVLVLVLGCCSVLAVSVTVIGSLGMGAALTFVLVCSNVVISALRRIIPDSVRIPSYIVIVAAFVTVVEMAVEAFLPSLYETLGIFLPLIVVNCIVLGRAEMFASKNTVSDSFFDGLGMGIGYTCSLCLIAVVRELVGAGTVAGIRLIPEGYQIAIMSQTPGGFFTYACLMATLVWLLARRGKSFKPALGCDGNCKACHAGCENAEKTEETQK